RLSPYPPLFRALVVAAVGVAEVVGEAGRVPVHPAVDGLGVGVEQQLVGVAAVPVGRVPGTVDPEAVALADAHPGQVGVPAEAVDLGEGDARLVALVVEQAQLDGLGDLGAQGEVGADVVVGRPERVRATGPDLDVVAGHAGSPLARAGSGGGGG